MIRIVTAALLLFASVAHAELRMSKPLIEAGVFGGAGYVPDYPAAQQGRARFLIFPVFQFRGRVLRLDDQDGSRARLLKNSLFALELSAAGSFPASSDDNRARVGMDDLQWLGELGPRLFANLYNEGPASLRTSLALRGAFSTDFASGHFRGLTLTPGLAFDHRRFGVEALTLIARLNAQWASIELQEYFYGVPDRDALPSRRAYAANSGYMGTTLTSAFLFEPGAYGLFIGSSITFHDGAANEGSPLFRKRINYAGFMGFRWFFFKSNSLGYL